MHILVIPGPPSPAACLFLPTPPYPVCCIRIKKIGDRWGYELPIVPLIVLLLGWSGGAGAGRRHSRRVRAPVRAHGRRPDGAVLGPRAVALVGDGREVIPERSPAVIHLLGLAGPAVGGLDEPCQAVLRAPRARLRRPPNIARREPCLCRKVRFRELFGEGGRVTC